MSCVIERISKPLLLGEGPHWDAEKKRLYFVDILKGAIYSYNPETKRILKTVVCDGNEPVSLIVPIKNATNKFVISYGVHLATLTWDEETDATDFKIIASTPDPKDILRFNDGKCSPGGILYAGTMERIYTRDEGAPANSALYAFKDNEIRQLLDNVILSNGLAWSIDTKKLYYVDTVLYRVDSFDCDVENVKLSNRKTVFDFKVNQIPGAPDGMAMDTNENLWIAVYLGARVVQINPTTGELLYTIHLPTPWITSVTFGGPDLNELYVTSASVEEVNDEDPNAGCVFKVTGLPAVGFPGEAAKI